MCGAIGLDGENLDFEKPKITEDAGAVMEIVLITAAYLLGSLPSGYILGLLAGVDVRKVGSGNVGATNVARVVGKGQGALTLIADAGKGFVPVFAASQFAMSPLITILAGVAAFMGHLYPVFLRFRGGKGVATALGVFLGLAPLMTLILIGIFVLAALSSRIVSLSSITAAAVAPLVFWLAGYPPMVIGTGAFVAAMIIMRHRSNIRRLIAGTEPRFGA